MERKPITEEEHDHIYQEHNRIGSFLTTVSHERENILQSLTAVDFIARSLAQRHVIAEDERDLVTSQEEKSKAMVLLDVLHTKESRDARAFLDLVEDTKQFPLTAVLKATLKEVESIVDRRGVAVAPTQYNLPLLSMANTEPQHAQNSKADIVATEDGMLKKYPREAWGASPKTGDSPPLTHRYPLPYIIISHTAQIGNFNTTEECLVGVQEAQQLNFSMGFSDISYNYLVGNNGAIYVGRGHDREGATTRGWNHRSLGIGFIGKYVDTMPSPAALDALKAFLMYLKKKGVLMKDFTIHCLRQVRPFPDAPGNPLFEEIKTWRSNDPEGWSWREKDDEEEANKSEGEPLSQANREKLREEQAYMVDQITNTLKLLEILGEKGMLNRFQRKKMKTECLRHDENSDEELKKSILEHVITAGTFADVQILLEALVEINQARVANVMYKFFPPEDRKKLTIQPRRRKTDLPPYRELLATEIKFSQTHTKDRLLCKLGAGKYGSVILASMAGLGNQPVAVKKLINSEEGQLKDEQKSEFLREANILYPMRHPNILRIYGTVCDKLHDYYWIVMEYMANGSLRNLLEKVEIPWPVKVRIMRDVASGLEFLHTPQSDRTYTVTHCDIKADNILIDEHYQAKISDFGTSVQNIITSSEGVKNMFNKGGTITHLAPELIIKENSDKTQKTDIWSFGILLFEVCAEETRQSDEWRVPFRKGTQHNQIAIAVGTNGRNPLMSNYSEQMQKIPLEECPKVLIDVMLHCCEHDPEKRPADFKAIAGVMDDAYEKEFKPQYKRSCAMLIIRHEDQIRRKEIAEQEAMEQEAMGQADRFELLSVAPLYGSDVIS